MPSPRKLSAAGTIRQLDPKLSAQRPLSFWAYGVGAKDGVSFASQWETLEWLRGHRFPVHPDVELLQSEENVVERCREWEARRGSLEFEIDGVVIKVNDAELQRRLGVVGREPAGVSGEGLARADASRIEPGRRRLAGPSLKEPVRLWPSPAAPVTSCCPTRTRPSRRSRAGRTSATSSPTPRC